MADELPRGRVTQPEGGRQLTKQSMAAETDINSIVARHVAHGVPFPVGGSRYGDFGSGVDFHSALSSIREAEQAFSRLPAAVRDFCQNDPGRFLDLVHDESKRPDLVRLGLVPEAVPLPVVGSPSGEGAASAAPTAGSGAPVAGAPGGV